VKKMAENGQFYTEREGQNRAKSSNEKLSRKYDRFGETIRYLTLEELQKLFDCIDNYTHKLMFRAIYELGCRVGEFVRIKLKHINFGRSSIFFLAENTKTGRQRSSWISRGLLNEIISLLRQQKRMAQKSLLKLAFLMEHFLHPSPSEGAAYRVPFNWQRSIIIYYPESFLFSSHNKLRAFYSVLPAPLLPKIPTCWIISCS